MASDEFTDKTIAPAEKAKQPLGYEHWHQQALS
jgi:hypothetical protein